MKLILVSENDGGSRLDKYLGRLLKEAGSSFIYKMLRKKNITLNGGKASGSEHLKAGDEIRLFFSDETFAKFTGTDTRQDDKEYTHAADKSTGTVKPGVEKTGTVKAGTVKANADKAGGNQSSAGRAGSLQFHETGSNKVPAVQLSRMPQIIYQDDHIIMFNKPAGMLSQKAEPSDISLNEYLLAYLEDQGLWQPMTSAFRPSVCNRLDRNTSGIVTAGITYKGARELSRIFRDRSCDKRYYALVEGVLTRPAHLKGRLVKDYASNISRIVDDDSQAPEIETEFFPVSHNDRCSLLEIHLITGKSHQIRAHLASIGHPIVGDRKYGTPSDLRYGAFSGTTRQEKVPASAYDHWYYREYHGRYQLLHSAKLTIPEDSILEDIAGRTITAPLPGLFQRVLKGEGIDLGG